MRTAITHGDTESLRAPESHIGAEFSRRPQKCEAEQIRRHRSKRSGRVGPLNKRFQVMDLAVGVRILNQGAEDAGTKFKCVVIVRNYLDLQRLRSRLNNFNRLRMTRR